MIENIPKHFMETYFEPTLNETLNKLEYDFQTNFEKYKLEFIENFKEFCSIVKEEFLNLEIAYISYNLMLTNILNHKYKYNIYVYDSNWYLGIQKDIKILEYDVTFIYKYFEEMWLKLLKERKSYIFKINDTDVNNLMIMIIDKFHYYVVSLMRNSIVELTETKEFINLNKYNEINIHTGKFYDEFDIVYIEKKGKNIIKIKKEINKSEKYINRDLMNLEIINIDFNVYDLRGTDFRNSRIIDVNLEYKMLTGAKFKNCEIINTSFKSSFLSEVNFENANLSGNNLTSIYIYKGKNNSLLDIGFLEANFKNTNLTNVDFTGSILENIDFTESILNNTIFDSCKLTNCKFTKKQLELIKLTEEQKKQIKIKR